jgi:hypothetical protein
VPLGRSSCGRAGEPARRERERDLAIDADPLHNLGDVPDCAGRDARDVRRGPRRGILEPMADGLLDLETDAIVDLRARVRRLRSRAILPSLVAYLVAAHVAVAAHMLGYWSIAGRLEDGSYFISKITLLLALLLPLPVVVGPACLVYLVLRGQARRTWARQYLTRGLPPEVVQRHIARVG